MNIEIINIKTLKIILTYEDIKKMSIPYTDIKYKDTQKHKTIQTILDNINKTVNIDLEDKEVFVETFPTLENGCIIYVNMIEKDISNENDELAIKKHKTVILKFENYDELFYACKSIPKKINYQSSLYKNNQNYFLVMQYEDTVKKLYPISEHGYLFEEGEIKSEFVKEHFDLIIEKKAVEKLIKLV